MDLYRRSCRGFDRRLPGMEKARRGSARMVLTALLPDPSVAAITGQRCHLEAHAAFEVSAVSLALDAGAERGDLPARGYGAEADPPTDGDTGGRYSSPRWPIGGGLLFFQPCDDEDAVAAQIAGFRQGQGTQGTDEYTPVGADNSAVQQHLPLVRVLRAAQDDTRRQQQGRQPGVASRRSRQHRGNGGRKTMEC